MKCKVTWWCACAGKEERQRCNSNPLAVSGLEVGNLVPIIQVAGCTLGPVWTDMDNLSPTGIQSPDHPACSKPLYYYTILTILKVLQSKSEWTCDSKGINVPLIIRHSLNWAPRFHSVKSNTVVCRVLCYKFSHHYSLVRPFRSPTLYSS